MTTHLLIVDDSQVIRTSLRALLGSVPGITTIREAATLGEALDSARRHPPTLVILDFSLPDGTGMDFIQPLKQLSPTVLIAVHTIHSHYTVRMHCLAQGVDCFFDKGADPDELLEVVRLHAALNSSIHPLQPGLSPCAI
jgi:DNA-binding NarL/FixJ family response regulator